MDQRKRVFLLIQAFLLVSFGIVSEAKSRCFYKTLGVSTACTPEELKKAYRKQCLVHHPDKGGNEEDFKEVTKAYDILSDESKRKLYDQYGEAAVNGNDNIPPHGHNQQGAGQGFFSFNQHQGGSTGDGFNGFRFSTDGTGMGGVSMEDMLRGATSQPSGTGGLNLDISELLRQMTRGGMEGTGQRKEGRNRQQAYERPCRCSLEDLSNGDTKKIKVLFPTTTINGEKNSISKIYSISLQKGWKEGTKVIFKASKDGRFPAMTFIIKEKKHPLFERKGNDLIYRVDLRKILSTAPGTVKLEVTLLDGEKWSRSLPLQSSFLRDGQTLSVSGKGMPIRNKNKGEPDRGNLIIEFYNSPPKSSKAKR